MSVHCCFALILINSYNFVNFMQVAYWFLVIFSDCKRMGNIPARSKVCRLVKFFKLFFDSSTPVHIANCSSVYMHSLDYNEQ